MNKDKYSALFSKSVNEWSKPPIDGIGYLHSEELLKINDYSLKQMVLSFVNTRYDIHSSRNHNNLWRKYSGLDSTFNKTVIDFGCGSGIESLELAKLGNEIILSDISENNLKLAERIHNLFGFKPKELVLIEGNKPFFGCSKFDIFHSCGVLHHTPYMSEIIEHSISFFTGNPYYRVLLYTDVCWKIRTDTDLDYKTPIHLQKGFKRFVKAMDDVGFYADWYDYKKLTSILPESLKIKSFNYIGGDCLKNQYAVVTIQGKNDDSEL